MNSKLLQAVYVYGRPAPHPNRLRLLPAIGATLVPGDFWLPWMHMPAPPAWRKWVSLLGCAIRFPDIRRWDLLIGDGPQHLPVVMKCLRRLAPNQKIVPYLAGEFPYFIKVGFYGPKKTALLKRWFSLWDAYLCISPMVAEIVREILPPERHGDVFTIQNFIRKERASALQEVASTLEAPRMVFIGHGSSGFRVYYKGLDLMFQSFALALEGRPDLHWTIVGLWDSTVRGTLEMKFPVTRNRVEWVGPVTDFAAFLSRSSLYLHCSRGDAFPNTVLEAMAAGVPAMVSEWTGAREVVAQVDPRLVVPLDAGAIAERILWYFSLPVTERRWLGERSRQVVLKQYTEERAIRVFRVTIRQILDHLGLDDRALPPWEDDTAC
jgi:glycosyltransferase involved in cell wall biosynthesis